jgi:hypothetical protein
MSRMRAAGVLGAMVLCGLLALATLAGAAGGDQFFKQLVQGFRQGCIAQSNHDGDLVPRKAFRDVCVLLADALSPETLSDLITRRLNETDAVADFLNATAALLNNSVPASPEDPSIACNACIDLAGDLEQLLVINGTAQALEGAFGGACETRFQRPADVSRCRQIVENLSIPALIGTIVTEFPPDVLCRIANKCPVNP